MTGPWEEFQQEAPPFARAQMAPTAAPAGGPWEEFQSKIAPVSPGSVMQAHTDAEAAALQGVSPHVTSKYFPEPPTRLGDMEEFDWGPGYKGANGEILRINPKTDFVARDPDGRMGVYARNKETDESKLTSLARLIMPGLATGPVTGASRGVQAAAGAAPAVPALRAPGAISTETGAALATKRAADAVADVKAFDQLDVRKPAIAFMQGPMASVGKQLSETPFVGAPMKNALDESLSGAARAAENVAERFGSAATPETAGTAIKSGIERFKDARPADVVERAAAGYSPAQRSEIIAAPARETSLKTKQAALYERAWSMIPEEMQQGRAVQNLPRVLGDLPEARQVLQEIQGRNLRMINASAEGAQQASRPIASAGLLGRMIDAISTKQWRASLQTMRDIRSEFRRLASGMSDTEKNTLRVSDIERVQSALTRDMIGLLERNVATYAKAGQLETARRMQRAVVEFRRADQFTRLSAQRMETIERLFAAPSAEKLYQNVAAAALSKGRGDLEKLRVLRKTINASEMDDLASAVLRQLGEPVGSARGSVQEIGFSPTSFLTRWANMTPEARALIFGHEHKQALDDLFRVVNRLANVEALANTSRTGTNMLNMGGLLGMAAMVSSGKIFLAGALGGAGLSASVLLSRPGYVRWVTEYAKIRAAVLRAPMDTATSAMVAHINRLGQMAQKDPLLLPVYRAVAEENRVGERDRQQQPVH